MTTTTAVAKIKIQAITECTMPDGRVLEEPPTTGGFEAFDVQNDPKVLQTYATMDAIRRASWTAYVYGRADVTITLPDGTEITRTIRVS